MTLSTGPLASRGRFWSQGILGTGSGYEGTFMERRTEKFQAATGLTKSVHGQRRHSELVGRGHGGQRRPAELETRQAMVDSEGLWS